MARLSDYEMYTGKKLATIKFFRTKRLRFVMTIAKILGVPVDVHQSFFTYGKRASKSLSAKTPL